MNSPALGLRVASVIFGLMGLAHLIRIILSMGLQVGGWLVGRRWSVIAVIVLAALCVWLWMLASKAAKAKNEILPAKPSA
jgi:type VI protein secretion system component VasK